MEESPSTRAVTGSVVWVGDRFVPNQMVVIEGDRIVEVTDRPPPEIPTESWGDVAILPGTVNSHGHSFQSLLKGFADDRSFEDWRDLVLYPFSERLGRAEIYAGALLAFAEAVLSGTTTTVDFFYLHDGGNERAQEVLRAARDIGIRLVFARTFYDEDAPTKAPARFRESSGDAARRCLELARAVEENPMVSVQPAPHSLHAASPETIRSALEVANELGVPCHLHLAEALYERMQIEQRFGTTPVRLLEREQLLDSRLVTVHAVWVDEDELDLIAASGAGVVHCPGANAFLGDGMAPLVEMLERGIRVGLGPDGGCANNRQSVFDEMRTASQLAKARLTDGGAIDAETVLRLGTAGGADLLGLPVGSLEPGRHADLVAVDLTDMSLQPSANLVKQIVNSMQPTAISKVMVGGEMVVEGGRLTRVDEAEIRTLVADAVEGWTRP
ncbi:MAG: amidohydrolase family protein [Actinomycetota bacterium]|nr:amidohydrolase family protein [Actinomycetota bacterium]